MPLKNMGNLNQRWGVCGFNSSLYALYNDSPNSEHGTVGLDRLAQSSKDFVKMLADYFRELQNNDQVTLQSIEAFTQSFDGFRSFTIKEFIRKVEFIDKISASKAIDEFSVAMPPQAVVDFLKRRCAFQNAAVVPQGVVNGAAPFECIIGLGGNGNGPRPVSRFSSLGI